MNNLQNFISPWTSPAWSIGFGSLFVLVILWSVVWKGWALWKSARAGSKPWFIALLVVNTLGILEILYIFVFSKKSALPTNDQIK